MKNKNSQVGSLIERQSYTEKKNVQIDESIMSSKARCTGSRVYIWLENNREFSKVNSCHPDNSDDTSES